MSGHGRARWVMTKQGPLLALIVVMFAIFFFQDLLTNPWYYEWMAVPGKLAQSWRNLLAGQATGTDFREFVTLLSCAFLHGGIDHVLYNMLFLWIFAALAADLLGQGWMFTIFGVTAICGSIVHVALNASEFIPMLGASGAVMGFEGAYLGLAVRWHLPDPHVWPMTRSIPPAHLALLAVLGVALDSFALMGNSGGNVAHGAHLGGFVSGLFLTALFAPKPKVARTR